MILLFFIILGYVFDIIGNFILIDSFASFLFLGIFYSLTFLFIFYIKPHYFGFDKVKIDMFLIKLKNKFK